MRVEAFFSDRRGTILAFVLLVLFWGSTFSAIDVGLRYAPPMLFAGLRCVLAGLVILPVALAWSGRPNLQSGWLAYALLTLLNVVLFLGLQTLAIEYLPSGVAAVLIYLQPILVGLLAYFFLSESLSPAKIAGLLLGFLGIVVVSAEDLFGRVPPGAQVGVAIAVSSAVAWAVGTVYFKKQDRVPTLWAVAVPFLAGGVVLSLAGLLTESPAGIDWTGGFVASLLYVAVVGTGLAWLLFLGLVRAGEASRVSAYIFVVPIVAILLGALFLNETLSITLLLGAALVVAGIYLVNRRSAVSGQRSAGDQKSKPGG